MFRNDDGINPVIGVIMMVAITVILAAVIAAFVYGVSGNLQKTDDLPKFNKTITLASSAYETFSGVFSKRWGILDTEGNGYYLMYGTDVSGLEQGGTYDITYYIDPNDKTRVIISIVNNDPKPSIYQCVTGSDGVCK